MWITNRNGHNIEAYKTHHSQGSDKMYSFHPKIKIHGKLKLFKKLQECSTLASFQSFPSSAAQPMNEARCTARGQKDYFPIVQYPSLSRGTINHTSNWITESHCSHWSRPADIKPGTERNGTERNGTEIILPIVKHGLEVSVN